MRKPSVSVGDVFSGDVGRFVVEDYISHLCVVLKDLDTGEFISKSTKWLRDLSKMKVRRSNNGTLYGIGFIGKGKYKPYVNGEITTQYRRWSAMMTRCYSDKFHERMPTYKDCEVCDEWHDFQVFARWFDENYPADGNDYSLDKDIKFKGNKLYSPDTCIFVTRSENSRHVKRPDKCCSALIIEDSKGNVYRVENQREFCRSLGKSTMFTHYLRRNQGREINGWKFVRYDN